MIAASIQIAKIKNKRRTEESFESWLYRTSPQYRWDLPHLVYMRPYLEHILKGERLKLLVLAPPQHGKSTHNTIHFGAAYIDKNPSKNIILGAYNTDFASDFSRDIREIVKRNYILTVDKATYWKLQAGGRFSAGGSHGKGGNITGKPADLVIVDDPIKSYEDAYSKTYRDQIWNWWNWVIDSRAHAKTSFILTLTPWHADDIAGRLLQTEGDSWIVLKFPAIARENDLLGRKPGDVLWPEKFPFDFLEEKRRRNPRMFQSLYQLEPILSEGQIFKREWWRYYVERPIFSKIIISYDTAVKEKETSDFTACTVWGVANNGYYLLQWYQRKLDFVKLIKQISIDAAEWHPMEILIEDKQSGSGAIQVLRAKTRLNIKGINPPAKLTKRERAELVTSTIECGNVKLPKDAPWLEDFIDIMARFPNDAHDDTPDSVSQFLRYVANKNGPVFIEL